MTVLILAGTYREAQELARGSLHREQNWRFVLSESDLMGIRDEPYIIGGTFWRREDASRLYTLTRLRDNWSATA